MSRTPTKPGVILFVDDNVDTVQDHRERLTQKARQKTYLCSSVDAAVRYLDKRSSEVCLAVIDLYIPNNWQSLAGYATKIPGGLKENHGQLLGSYLREKHKGVPYVYLSAFTNTYAPHGHDKPEMAFSKKSDDLDRFLSQCQALIAECTAKSQDANHE
jgi:hypothetical protein